MRNYVRKTELMDKERGDLLTIRRQDVAALFAPNFPHETRRDILDAFIGWFAGGEALTLDDPLANAFLQTYIGRQKESVRNYLDFCDRRKENGSGPKRKKNEGTRETSVSPVPRDDGEQVFPNIKESNVRVKEISNEKDISFTVGNGVTRGQEPRMTVSPTVDESVDDDSVRMTGIRTVGMIAPPIDARHYSEDERENYQDLKNMGDLDDAECLVNYALGLIEEKDNALTKNALKKRIAEIGEEMFMRAAYRFDCDLYAECEKYHVVDQPPPKDAFPEDSLHASLGRHFMARLCRLKKALAALGKKDE